MSELVYDVVIVGGGGSGLAAAARCSELGLSVVVLEKQSTLGGTTGIAVGSFTANRTADQKQHNVTDTLDWHAEDAGRFASPEIESRNEEGLRRFFLDHSANTLEWLKSLGLNFHGPSPEPPNRVPRMHNVVPNAKAYIAALQARTLRHGNEIHCNANVVSIVKKADRVVGVHVNTTDGSSTYIARRGVILAAGDYANSPDMISRFKGPAFSAIEGINPYATGDGHRLAESAGAKLINMDITYGPELRFVSQKSGQARFMQLLPSSGWGAKMLGWSLPWLPQRVIQAFIKRLLVTWQHPENELFADGAILINQNGERFCDETRSPEREIAVARQPNKQAYLLLDEALCQRYQQWPHFISTAPEIAYAYVNDYLKLRSDIAVAADSLSQIAAARNLPVDRLQQTVDEVRCSASETIATFQGSKWVLLGPLKAWFTTTEGGAAINEQFEVLDDEQAVIPGLYAIGQNGLGGQILWGHGLHIAWAMTSGRLVAEHLAEIDGSSTPKETHHS